MTNLNHRAAGLYDRALDSGAPFNPADVTAMLIEEVLNDQHDVTEIVGLAAAAAVARVDKERSANDAQGSLFDSLDQSVPIADGQRIARRQMTLSHWTEHLAHIAENVSRVNNSAARENRRFSALAPFLSQGLSTEMAVKSWQEQYPDAVLA